jgi:hypothetical protein
MPLSAIARDGLNRGSFALQPDRPMTDSIDTSSRGESRGDDDPAQPIRRLTLLNRIANSFILASASQDNFDDALSSVAQEIGANFYFNYQIDDEKPGFLALRLSGGISAELERFFETSKLPRHRPAT